MNPKLTFFNNGTIAAWIFINVCFLGFIGATTSATAEGIAHADKQYYSSSNLLATAQQTGMSGILNAREINAIMHLRYPQRYESIKNRFGMPFARNQWFDVYRIEGTNNWIAIEYRNYEVREGVIEARAAGWVISDGF